jgi:hypothetical protein
LWDAGQRFGAQQSAEVLIGQEFIERRRDEHQSGFGNLGFADERLLALAFPFEDLHQPLAGATGPSPAAARTRSQMLSPPALRESSAVLVGNPAASGRVGARGATCRFFDFMIFLLG